MQWEDWAQVTVRARKMGTVIRGLSLVQLRHLRHVSRRGYQDRSKRCPNDVHTGSRSSKSQHDAISEALLLVSLKSATVDIIPNTCKQGQAFLLVRFLHNSVQLTHHLGELPCGEEAP